MFFKGELSPSLPNEVAQIINTGMEFPPRSCLITFDDGWKDNYTYAYPVLKRHHIPALIFLTTDFIGTSRAFWHEQLGDLLSKVRGGIDLGLLDRLVMEYPLM